MNVREGAGTLELGRELREFTLIKRSACAEYARRTILGSEEERGRIRGRIVEDWFVVV